MGESQVIDLNDIVASFDKELSSVFSDALNSPPQDGEKPLERLWKVICEQIEIGSLSRKRMVLHLADVLLNDELWPGKYTEYFLDAVLALFLVITQEPLNSQYKNELLEIASFASSSIVVIGSLLRSAKYDTTGRILETPFVNLDPPGLLFYFVPCIKIVKNRNFHQLPDNHRHSTLVFMRGVYELFTLYEEDHIKAAGMINPAVIPEFASLVNEFCESAFPQEQRETVLDILNWLIGVSRIILGESGPSKKFYRSLTEWKGQPTDVSKTINVLVDTIPFSDDLASNLSLSFLKAMGKIYDCNFRATYTECRDAIFRRLIYRLISSVTDRSENVQQMVQICFEKAATLFGYSDGLILKDWIRRNSRYIIPQLLLNPSPSSSKVHHAIAKLCETNRQNLIMDNIPYVIVRMTVDPMTAEQHSEIDGFVASEGRTNERRLSLTEYVSWQLYACVYELVLNLAASKDSVMDTLSRISLMVSRGENEDVNLEASDRIQKTAAVVDFLKVRLLGVLTKFRGKFVARYPFDEKLLALRSLIMWMEICAGDVLSEVTAKMVDTLRAASAIEDKRMRPYVASAWEVFLRNISAPALKEVVLPVFVAITPLLSESDTDVKATVGLILDFIFRERRQCLEKEIVDIVFLSKAIDSALLQQYCPAFDDDQRPLTDLLAMGARLLKFEHPDVKRLVLERLKALLRHRSKEFYKLILEPDNVDEVVHKLLQTLTSTLCHPDIDVRRLAAVCIGDVGAIDPGRLRTGSFSANVLMKQSEFAFYDFDGVAQTTTLPVALLKEVTRLLLGASDTFYDVCSFTLQKILEFFGCRNGGIRRKETDASIIWSKLDAATKKILTPFLTTDYKIEPKNQSFDDLPSPLFGSERAADFKQWLTTWLASLISKVKQAKARVLFTDLSIMAGMNIDFAQFLLPHVIVQRLLEGQEDENSAIFNELLAAMSGLSLSGVSVNDVNLERCAAHVVFCVLDFLYKWTLEMQESGVVTPGQKIVEAFIDRIPKETASLRAAMFEAFPRALIYYEAQIDKDGQHQNGGVGTLLWCSRVKRLQEIYSKLDDVDGVAGSLIALKKYNQGGDKEQVLALEATGYYAEALPFWEAMISITDQNNGNDVEKLDNHIHLVNCFLRLNQSSTCERYLSDLSRTCEKWKDALHPYRVDALLKLQQWDELEKELNDNPSATPSWPADVGQLLISARAKNVEAFNAQISVARDHVLDKLSLATRDNGTCDGGYGYMLRLHMLSEIEQRARQLFASAGAEDEATLEDMMSEWEQRFKLVQPSMENMYALLDLRKQILRLGPPSEKTEKAVGACWLEAAKIARKTLHYQPAWNLLVKAKGFGIAEIFTEEAKLLWNKDQKTEAITCLREGTNRNYYDLLKLKNCGNAPEARRFAFAKAHLLYTNYCRESSSLNTNEISRLYDYLADSAVFQKWEESHYYAGLHFDQLSPPLDKIPEPVGRYIKHFCCRAMKSYATSLEFGSRYVHHSMPRLLTFWLDYTQELFFRRERLGAPGAKAAKTAIDEYNSKLKELGDAIDALNGQMDAAITNIPTYQFYCCFSQLISRICHPCPPTYLRLKEILARLLASYPHQCVWMLISVKRSSVKERIDRCIEVIRYAREKNAQLEAVVTAVDKLAELLIGVCEKPVDAGEPKLDIRRDFRQLFEMFGSSGRVENKIIIPLQVFMDVTYPPPTPGRSLDAAHRPFNEKPVFIQQFLNDVEVFPSMQRPKKLQLRGSDGEVYAMMCKPKDDLRLDKRLMEFTNLVNGCMLRDPEARRRELHIRTYTVTPLNERCGLLEWVPNLVPLRTVYMRLCKEFGKPFPSVRDMTAYSLKVHEPLQKKLEVFEKYLLPRHPLLLRHWFPRTFPEPTAWYKARINYIRTAAVMSMVGFILGLGDRHNENMLFDKTCGDIVHVDFNCLFNRGESLEVPEVVPFRLTRNMIDAMGPLGYEGHFRKASEIVMKLMREEAGMLRTVLQTFLHDPLVEWQRSGSSNRGPGRSEGKPKPRPEEDKANEHLTNIDWRLGGRVKNGIRETYGSPLSVEGQVNVLIQQATDPARLAQMYIGWGAYI